MPKEVFHRPDPATDAPFDKPLPPLQPIEGSNGSQEPQSPRRRAVSRALQAKVTFVVGLTDEDGMPALAIPTAETAISWRDPTGKERDMVQQFADLKSQAERQVVEEWERDRGS